MHKGHSTNRDIFMIPEILTCEFAVGTINYQTVIV